MTQVDMFHPAFCEKEKPKSTFLQGSKEVKEFCVRLTERGVEEPAGEKLPPVFRGAAPFLGALFSRSKELQKAAHRNTMLEREFF